MIYSGWKCRDQRYDIVVLFFFLPCVSEAILHKSTYKGRESQYHPGRNNHSSSLGQEPGGEKSRRSVLHVAPYYNPHTCSTTQSHDFLIKFLSCTQFLQTLLQSSPHNIVHTSCATVFTLVFVHDEIQVTS